MPPPPEEPPIYTALPEPEPFPPGPAGVDDIQQPLYDGGAAIFNDYTLDPGVCVLPLAEDPPTDPDALADWSPVVVLRLHAPYRVRRVRYNANKQNNPPVLPTPADSGSFVFVGAGITFWNGLNAGYGNYNWSVDAAYTFVEDCVSRNRDGFVLGSPPYNTPVESSNTAQYTGGDPQTGAIAAAGAEAVTGWQMSQSIGPALNGGIYAYNNRAYFPGTFFSDLLNS